MELKEGRQKVGGRTLGEQNLMVAGIRTGVTYLGVSPIHPIPQKELAQEGLLAPTQSCFHLGQMVFI